MTAILHSLSTINICQDMWRLSGLTRRIYLSWRHATHVRVLHVRTAVLQQGEMGIVHAQVAAPRVELIGPTDQLDVWKHRACNAF